MSSTTSAITSASVKATLNGEKVDIRRARFLCMTYNAFDGGDSRKKLDRAESNYAKTEPAKYFVEEGKVESPPTLNGCVVFQVPENYVGHHSDYDREDPRFKIVGTLMKLEEKEQGVMWKIETDPEIVEQIRRAQEVAKMNAGKMFIGTHGTDSESYLASLAMKDQQSESGMATRGHGLMR